MIVQNISCGKCKAPFKHSGNYLDVIGSPFFVCQQCGSANMHKEITEWELHPPMRKFAFFPQYDFLHGLQCDIGSATSQGDGGNRMDRSQTRNDNTGPHVRRFTRHRFCAVVA